MNSIRVTIDLVPTSRMRPAGSNEPFLADISGLQNSAELLQTILTQIQSALSNGQIPSLIVGDYTGGNYLRIGPTGSIRAYGTASSFRDELQSVTGAQITSPAGDFEQNIPEAAVTAKTSARYPTDYITTNHQINHDWIPGTVVDTHIHWWQTTANTPHWVLGYRWQKQGSAKTTAWTPIKWTSNVYTWTPGTTLNQITDFGGITPPPGYGSVSDILQLRLYRDYTNVSGLFVGGDPVAANQDITNMDSHIEIDSFGSDGEYTKYE